MDNLPLCFHCKKEISKKVRKCPHCGSSHPHGRNAVFPGCLTFLVSFPLLAFIFGRPDNPETILTIAVVISALVAFMINESNQNRKKQIRQELETSKKRITRKKTQKKPDRQVKTNKLILFTYSDANGNYSKRTVDLERVYSKDGHQYFDAFCRTRESGRTFRVDRITGEVYVPHEARLCPPEEYFSQFDIKHDPVGNRLQDWEEQRSEKQTTSFTAPTFKENVMAPSKGRVIAPSGFEFPFFPYTEDTFVKIKDSTSYKSDFMCSYNRETYSDQDFEEDLESYMPDIEVQDFLTSLKQKNLKKLGLKKPPRGWDTLHDDIAFRDDDEGEAIWPATKTIHKQFVKSGLLTELSDTRKNREICLQYSTAKKLKEICRKHGLKLSGKKSELIDRILDHGKTKVPRLVTPNKKYFSMLEKIAEKYIESIEEQLMNKPDVYHQVIWEQVSDDCYIGAQLPEHARRKVKCLHERYS